MCQLVICGVQRAMVRPSLLISGGQDSFWRSSASRVGVSERESGAVNFVDAAHGFLSVRGTADLPVGITRVEEAPQPDLAPVAVSSCGPRSGAGVSDRGGLGCGPCGRGFRWGPFCVPRRAAG